MGEETCPYCDRELEINPYTPSNLYCPFGCGYSICKWCGEEEFGVCQRHAIPPERKREIENERFSHWSG